MAENFHKAALRHFDAADLLYRESRLAEASHLYAYAGECALKAILAGQRKPRQSGHINDHLRRTGAREDLIGRYQASQQGHRGLPLPRHQQTWFEAWTIDERYSDGVVVTACAAKHKADADIIRTAFNKARSGGA